MCVCKNKLFRRIDKLTREELCHMVKEHATIPAHFYMRHYMLFYAVTESQLNIIIRHDAHMTIELGCFAYTTLTVVTYYFLCRPIGMGLIYQKIVKSKLKRCLLKAASELQLNSYAHLVDCGGERVNKTETIIFYLRGIFCAPWIIAEFVVLFAIS